MNLHWGWLMYMAALCACLSSLLHQINALKERLRQIQFQEDDRFSKLLESVGKSLQRLRMEIDQLIEFKERIELQEKVKKKQGASDQSSAA